MDTLLISRNNRASANESFHPGFQVENSDVGSAIMISLLPELSGIVSRRPNAARLLLATGAQLPPKFRSHLDRVSRPPPIS